MKGCRPAVSESPMSAKCRRARVTATLSLLSSLKNPTVPDEKKGVPVRVKEGTRVTKMVRNRVKKEDMVMG